MERIYFTNSPKETKKLGEDLAREILKTEPKKEGSILALKGDLGGGKTTFLQGFAKGLRIQQKILSPTFVIIKRFKIDKYRKSPFRYFYHIDCYRIGEIKEILKLGLKEIISDPQNIVAIEWAERIRKILPKKTIWINFEFTGRMKRTIAISLSNK